VDQIVAPWTVSGGFRFKKTWIAQFDAPRPKIVLTFLDPTGVTGIEIQNGYSAEDDSVECKFMQVFADGKSVWAGRLQTKPVDSTEVQQASTFVFFVCARELQEKIKNADAVHRNPDTSTVSDVECRNGEAA
jgi:hypothetical protein